MKPYTFGNFFARGERYFHEKYMSKCPWNVNIFSLTLFN